MQDETRGESGVEIEVAASLLNCRRSDWYFLITPESGLYVSRVVRGLL